MLKEQFVLSGGGSVTGRAECRGVDPNADTGGEEDAVQEFYYKESQNRLIRELKARVQTKANPNEKIIQN